MWHDHMISKENKRKEARQEGGERAKFQKTPIKEDLNKVERVRNLYYVNKLTLLFLCA